MTTLERIYRILLKAYPESYRRGYEDPMVQHFRDQLRAAIGERTLLRFWVRTITDLARTALARHVERWLPCHGKFRFTGEAGKAIFFARYEASSFARSDIALEHLLLGLLRNDAVLPSKLVCDVVRRIEGMEAVKRRMPASEDLPLSPECKLAIKDATWEAKVSVEKRVGSRHLLEAIFQQESTLAVRILRDCGIDRSWL